MTKRVLDRYRSIQENNKSFTTVVSWMGYKTSYLEIAGDERFEGRPSYNISKKINLAIDMLTSQSNKPLKFLMEMGFVFSGLSLVYIIVQVIKYFVTSDVPTGWTSMIASIFLMGGIMLASLGGVGIYVGNIFNQIKGRPEYIVDEILNDKK